MSKIPINLPARIMRGQTVTAAHMNALRESIYRLASKKDEQIKSLPGGRIPLPYQVTLITTQGETPTYEVTVGWGYVCERIPGAGDAIAYHEAANMWDTEDPSQLRKFPITVGQAVYIRTEVDEDGKIGISEGDAVTIVIEDDEESSTHYTPKVDDLDSAGAAGHYLYKLAVLEAAVSPSTTPTLEKWLTGSHIDHYQELPSILTATAGGTGIGVIPKEWSDSEKAYKLRAISQKDPVTADPEADPPVRGEDVQIHVEQETDRILIKGNGKGRVVKYQIGTETPVTVATFDDGLETEGTEEGNEITIPIPAESSHPWKATENGTQFITIAPGELLAVRTSSGGYPFYWENLSYAGGNIEVTSSTGYILISISKIEEQAGSTNYGDSGILASPDSFSVEFQPTMSDVSHDMGFPICEVALSAGVATVTKQILTHNPSPSVTWISPAP